MTVAEIGLIILFCLFLLIAIPAIIMGLFLVGYYMVDLFKALKELKKWKNEEIK